MKAFWAGAAVSAISLAVVIGPGALPASADGPSQSGWWWQGNPGPVPEAGVSASQPPPDVPEKGLLIEGSTTSTSGSSDSGPTAYGALVYNIPDGATVDKLNLTVGSAATTPNTTLEICRLSNPGFQPEYGGTMAHAPAFDCKANATAAPSSNGNTYVFNSVASMAADGILAIAILPTSPTDRVVLTAPDHNSLSVTPKFDAGDSGSTGGVVAGSAGAVAGTASQRAPRSAGAFPSASSSPVATSSVATPQLSTPAPAPTTDAAPSPKASGNALSQSAAATPSGTGTSDDAEPLVVGLLIAAAVVGTTLWTAAGRAAARAAIQTT